jgi:hypothetical protein
MRTRIVLALSLLEAMVPIEAMRVLGQSRLKRLRASHWEFEMLTLPDKVLAGEMQSYMPPLPRFRHPTV